MNLGFQMLLYMSKNLGTDFSNKRKWKIPPVEAELQVCLNCILPLAGSWYLLPQHNVRYLPLLWRVGTYVWMETSFQLVIE